MITNWFDKKNSRDTWNRRPDHWARVYLAAAPAFAWIAFSPLCQPHRRCIPRCEFSCALTSFDFVFHQLRRPTLCKHGTRRAHRLIVNLVLEVFFRCSSKTAKKEPIIMIKKLLAFEPTHTRARDGGVVCQVDDAHLVWIGQGWRTPLNADFWRAQTVYFNAGRRGYLNKRIESRILVALAPEAFSGFS